MPWFKIDDGFWSHPKVLELSDEAVALWVRAGSYCAGHLTDGTVKRSTLRVLGATNDAATELVIAGLWDHGDGSWAFHDWEDYQPTREEVLKERAAATERKRKSRERSRGESRVTDGVTDGVSHTAPTRPDPTRPDPPPSHEGGDTPPPRFCAKHPFGTEDNCRPCGTARRIREDWDKAEKNKPSPTVRRPKTCTVHAEYPLPCPRCEEGT